MAKTVSVYKIPFAINQPYFVRPVQLQGAVYMLEFQYNQRESRWYMNILDSTEAPLLQGIRLDINRNLTGQYGSYVLPTGVFVCRDTTGKNQPPEFNSFTVDHQLLFLDFEG